MMASERKKSHIRLMSLIILMCLPLTGCSMSSGDWLANIARHVPTLITFIVALSYVIGIYFIAIAVFKLRAYGHMTVFMNTHASFGPALAYFVIGLILFYFPATINFTMMTIFGYNAESKDFWNFPPPGEMDFLKGYADSVIQIIRIFGYISFFRGWIMLAKLGSQGSPPGILGKALTHIIGGILAINIVGTWRVISNTFNGF